MLPGKKYTPQDFIDILRRRGWLLVVPPIVTLFGALIYSSTVPNLYRSDMLIAIVPQRVPDDFVRSTVTLRTEERLDAISVEVRSRPALEQLINEFNLYVKERDKFPMEDVVQQMRESIEVELERPRPGPRGESQPPPAFHVRFKYTDPQIAARVTQRLGSAFVDQNIQDRGALAGATNQFLEVQLAQARERLEAQERRLEAFRERNGHALPSQLQTNLQAIQSTQLQIQALVESIARDRDRKLMLERLFNEASNEPPQAPPAAAPQAQTTVNAPATGTSQQQLSVARTTLASLQMRLRPEHPDILRTERIIAELERKVAEETTAAASGQVAAPVAPVATAEESQRRERLRQMAAEIESLDRQTLFKESEEKRLRSVAAEYQRRIEAVPGVESEWVALSRDYDTQQAAYRDLLSKSENSKLAVELERRQIGEQFRILDPARVPVNPIGPLRLQITGIGFAVGLLIGFAIAGLLEFKDSSFRSEAEVFDVLALPVIAAVPYVETMAERSRRNKRHLMLAATALVLTVGAAYVFWALRLWTVVV